MANFCGHCGKPLAQCVCGPRRRREAPAQVWQGGGSYTPPTISGNTVRLAQSAAMLRHGRAEGLTLAQDESLVRRYVIGRKSLFRGETLLLVTNRRLIRLEENLWLGLHHTRLDELRLDRVLGLSCALDRGITARESLSALLVFMASLVCFATGALLAGLIALLGVVALTAVSMRQTLRLHFRTHAGPALPIRVSPGDSCTPMLRELGACISDLQRDETLAISRWRMRIA